MNLRRCNRLWWEDVNKFSLEDLKLLKHAFEIGFIPLHEDYGDHNEKWVAWKNALFVRIDKVLNND